MTEFKKRAVGPGAAARKYDLLSALMAHGLAGDKHRQRLVLRFMALITTRYNWQRDELSMGHEEIARLWVVDPRTVKRDMARLKALGWLVVKRAGARGRVGLYGLGLERIELDTRAAWGNIGADFCARMGEPEPESVSPKVVPLRPATITEGGLWGQVQTVLQDEDPAVFSMWFAGLRAVGVEEGRLMLMAPSRFHASYVATHLQRRLDMAVRRVDPSVGQVVVTE